MPQRRNNQTTLRRSPRQPNTDDSSVDEDTPLSQLPSAKKKHPGQPKNHSQQTNSHTARSNPPVTVNSTSQPSGTTSTRDAPNLLTIPSESSSTGSNSDSSRPSANNTNTNTTTTIVHKKVNSKSTNRRQCKRASDDLSRSTPDQNNLSQRKHAFTTRLTFKITCASSDNAEKTLLDIFEDFIDELIRADTSAAILPWKSIHRSQGSITKASSAPKNAKALRVYLNRFYINRMPDTDFTTYPGIHIGHDKPLEDLRDELSLWLQDGDHGLFYKMLQVEESAEIGWLLYSTKEMDAGALVDEIEDLIGLKIGLRWKIIDVGAKGKLPESQRIRALNVEVNARNRWDAQRSMIHHFGRNMQPKDYPNGIRLRFVKNKKDGINSIEKSKIEKLRARQQSFLSNIQSTSTWDIIQLDYAPSPDDPTLRQMLMAMTTADSNIPLFHCVDLDWRGEGYIFQYAPGVKIEAECTIDTLLPILKYKYPAVDVEKFFSHEAIDRCEDYKYDATKGVVVDGLIEDHLTFIDEENLLGFTLTNELVDTAAEGAEESRPTQVLYNDTDSVSTLAKPRGTHLTPHSVTNDVSFTRADTRVSDNTSVTSSTSTVTMETVNAIETRLTALSTHMYNSDRKMDKLMEYFLSNNARGQGASSATTQSGTTDSGHSKAGEGSPPISGGVP